MSSWVLSWWQPLLLLQILYLLTSRQPSRTCWSSFSNTRKSWGLRKPVRSARSGQWSDVMSVMLRSPSARCMAHICVTYKIYLMGQRGDWVGKGACLLPRLVASVSKPSRLTRALTPQTVCWPLHMCCVVLMSTHMPTPHNNKLRTLAS